MDFNKVKMPDIPGNCPQCSRKTIGAVPFCECNFDLRHGTAARQRKFGVCIYCPNNGRMLLSEEHVFGKWLTRRFPKSPTVPTKHTLSRPEDLEFGKTSVVHQRTYDKRGHQYYQTVWNVCEKCNGGWMSRLHIEAQNIIIRFAGGEWPDLTAKESFILARWATMVAINLECMSRQIITTQFQKDALKNGSMPEGWRIAVCRMKGNQHAGYSFLRKKAQGILIGDQYLTMQSVFFCIENVAFHALSSYSNLLLQLGLLEHVNPPVFDDRKVWPNCESRKIGRKIYYSIADINRLQDKFAYI
jgi:hypothetical protein